MKRKELFYLKFKRGYLVYLKEESVASNHGRRKRFTTIQIMQTLADPVLSQMFEVKDYDPKYEERMDKLEIEELIRREHEVEADQMELF